MGESEKKGDEEVQYNIKILKDELKSVLQNLERSESEKGRLHSDIISANEKLKESEENNQKFQAELKSYKEEAESRYNSHLQSFQKVEEDHKSSKQRVKEMEDKTVAIEKDLLEAQAELCVSKSKFEDLEQKISLNEASIETLTHELRQCKASEECARKKALEMEGLHAVSKELLQQKTSKLQEVESKYENEVKIKEDMEAKFTNQEKNLERLEETIAKLTKDIGTWEAISSEANSSLMESKEASKHLEDKLNESLQNLSKTDTRLTQALTYNTEIEEKLKFIEESFSRSAVAAECTTKRNLELEDLIQCLSAKRDELKENLMLTEKKNTELDQKLVLLEVKINDDDQKLKKLHEKTSELRNFLKSSEEESSHFRSRVEDLEDKLSIEHEKYKCVEAELSKFQLKVSELERTVETFQKRSEGFEIALKAGSAKECELINELNSSNEEKSTIEESLKNSQQKVLEMENQLGVLQFELKSAEEKNDVKEKDILEKLRLSEEQLQVKENIVKNATAKCFEFESLHEKKESEAKELSMKKQSLEEKISTYQIQLTEATEKAEALKFDLEASLDAQISLEKTVDDLKIKIHELELKSLSCQDQLSMKIQSLEEQDATYEVQIVEATEKIATLKANLEESYEAKISLEKTIDELKILSQGLELKALSHQDELSAASERMKIYEDQLEEATEKAEFLKSQLDIKIPTLEQIITELSTKIKEAETKAEHTLSENAIISSTNTKIKEELKVNMAECTKLKEILSLIEAEKNETTEQMVSHLKKISELSDQHSRELDLHLETQSRAKKTEDNLHEDIEKLKLRETDLSEKLVLLESQMEMQEKQANEAAAATETKKTELNETLLKIKKFEEMEGLLKSRISQCENDNEGLASTNLKLTNDLASYETNLNKLQKSLDAVLSDKEETICQLHNSTKEIEDLKKKLTSEGERLQSQVSFIFVN